MFGPKPARFVLLMKSTRIMSMHFSPQSPYLGQAQGHTKEETTETEDGKTSGETKGEQVRGATV